MILGSEDLCDVSSWNAGKKSGHPPYELLSWRFQGLSRGVDRPVGITGAGFQGSRKARFLSLSLSLSLSVSVSPSVDVCIEDTACIDTCNIAKICKPTYIYIHNMYYIHKYTHAFINSFIHSTEMAGPYI